MKICYSTSKAMLLGAALLFLSAKGGQELFIDDDFSLVVNLPAWLLGLKTVAAPFAAVLLVAFGVLAVIARKRPARSPLLAVYIVVVAYYFMRSAWLGSNVQGNLLAVGILLPFGAAISLDFGTNQARGLVASGWMRPLVYFFVGYTLATGLLLLTGFGYAQVGARFLGLTYHPNAEGALAGLAAGLFLGRLHGTGVNRKQRVAWLALLGLAILLVVASGSRAAVLMVLLAFLSISPAGYVVTATILAAATLYAMSGVEIANSDGSIAGAVTRMLTATTDNRGEVWGQLVSDFRANPFTGVGDMSQVSGSGFLTAFAGAGLFGGVLFLLGFALAAAQAARVILDYRRKRQGSTKVIAAVLLLQILLEAVFEGSMFDKFSPIPLLTMILLLALSSDETNGEWNGVPAR